MMSLAHVCICELILLCVCVCVCVYVCVVGITITLFIRSSTLCGVLICMYVAGLKTLVMESYYSELYYMNIALTH